MLKQFLKALYLILYSEAVQVYIAAGQLATGVKLQVSRIHLYMAAGQQLSSVDISSLAAVTFIWLQVSRFYL
jgi:hypothetical protein